MVLQLNSLEKIAKDNDKAKFQRTKKVIFDRIQQRAESIRCGKNELSTLIEKSPSLIMVKKTIANVLM